jgi:methyl-accepting chemotaxis protein
LNGRAALITRRLKVWQKLAIVGLAFTIPLALTTVFLVNTQSNKINVASAELNGITYLKPLAAIELGVAQHAAAQRETLRGNAAAAAMEQASASAVNSAFDQLALNDAKLGQELKTDPADLAQANLSASSPANLRAQWQIALGARSVATSDQAHQQLITGVRGLITQVGNTSNLILDPDIDTYYTAGALLVREPVIVSLLSGIENSVASIPPQGLTLGARGDLSGDAAILQADSNEENSDLQTAFRGTKHYNQSTTLEPVISPLLQAANTQTSSLGSSMARLISMPSADPRLVTTVEQGAASSLAAHAALWPPLLDQEASMLHHRKNGALTNRWAALVAIIVVFLLTAGLMAFVARRLAKDVDRLSGAARAVASGDLTARAPVSSQDELGLLSRDFNEMATRLDELSGQVRNGALGINTAATSILNSVSQQTAGAAQQSAAISEISATTEEVRATAEMMLGSAQQMADLARDALEVSNNGAEAMDSIRAGMNSIREQVKGIAADILALAEQTQQIGEITALVSDLADQSNLLALNANIEAAKAGEQGKGFAVVAAQVRLLAEQSKQATSQVASILSEIQTAAHTAVIATEAGNKVVEEGIELADRAGAVIGLLGDTVTRTADSSEQIANSVEEQKLAIEQISQALSEVNQATTQFVAGTEISQQTAQDLSSLAGPLRELTERYKVSHRASDGSPADNGE